jgi:hypothetical protein
MPAESGGLQRTQIECSGLAAFRSAPEKVKTND